MILDPFNIKARQKHKYKIYKSNEFVSSFKHKDQRDYALGLLKEFYPSRYTTRKDIKNGRKNIN